MVELEAPFICEDGGGGTAVSCTNKQHQRRNMGPTEAQLGGDKYVPDTEEVYWQRDPADLPELYQKELSVRQGHRFRSSTRMSFRGYDNESRHGGGQYTTTRPHRHQSCTEVI